MRTAAAILSLLFTPALLPNHLYAQSASPIRVALIGFSGNAATLAARVIAAGLTDEMRVTTVDPALVDSAVKGIHYDGSINMSLDDARRLGGAAGCDFFIAGKAELVPRSEAGRNPYVEALVALFIVDARAGSLIRFDFIENKAESEESAAREAAVNLERRIPGYIEDLIRRVGEKQPPAKTIEAESLEEMPEPGSAPNDGFNAPVFTNRIRPVYTDEADRADISATVEARAVLKANGEIGMVQIVRWAGYGLDEAAAQAIRQLKFSPATRDGKPISVRALIQYNFRRSRGPDPLPSEPEKKAQPPERDLRQIFKPKIRPPAIKPV